MSFFKSINTKINDAECLQAGLKELGYSPETDGTKQQVRGHGSEKLSGEIILKKEDTKYRGDIGFDKKTDGTYSLVYDSYVVPIKQQEFMDKVTAAYAKAKVKKQMRQFPNFRQVSCKEADGTTKIVYQEVSA
jgi:uncharacterized protein DUF1257